MAEPQTCGQGLAENAAIPRLLGELVDALADNLERHMPSLDVTDDAGRAEHSAYERLTGRHRRIADDLRAVAEDMASQRDLPGAPHDMQVLGSPAVAEAFDRFVAAERALAAHLEHSLSRDEQMLRAMRG
jgi:hypothetical protein